MSYFEKFKEEFPSKEKFFSSLADRQTSDKEFEHVLIVLNKFKRETIKNQHDLHLTLKRLGFLRVVFSHISRRTYLISVLLYEIAKQSI